MNTLLNLSREQIIWVLSGTLVVQLLVMLAVRLLKKKKSEEEEF